MWKLLSQEDPFCKKNTDQFRKLAHLGSLVMQKMNISTKQGTTWVWLDQNGARVGWWQI